MKNTMSDASCELMGDFFATLAHTTRMRIFCALQREPKTVTEIATEAGISITNASQHLRIMRDRGAVIAEKHAQSVRYHLADMRLVEAAMLIRAAILDHLRREAEQAGMRPARRTSSEEKLRRQGAAM